AREVQREGERFGLVLPWPPLGGSAGARDRSGLLNDQGCEEAANGVWKRRSRGGKWLESGLEVSNLRYLVGAARAVEQMGGDACSLFRRHHVQTVIVQAHGAGTEAAMQSVHQGVRHASIGVQALLADRTYIKMRLLLGRELSLGVNQAQ